MDILKRFLNYIKVPTSSDSNSTLAPSTDSQRVLAEVLVNELVNMGVEDIYYDKEHCYVYAHLKGSKDVPSVGFISHLDTSEDAKGDNINPKIITNYDGNDIKLNEEIVLSSKVYPDLPNHINKTLITTDGKTLLGADDKAGIAEIMTMLEYFCTTKEEHGDIYICFTPDEEIGMGTEYLDYQKFNPDYAYTVDGSSLGEISYENFNAASAKIEINGVSTHCGSAKGVMVNSLLLANAINSLLPHQVPTNTEGYEGFYHLEKINGTVSHTSMSYLIRDFNKQNFEKRKKVLQDIVNKLNQKYNNCISLEITDTYYNMMDIISDNIEVVDVAKEAIKKSNVSPLVLPIRGGTDGTDVTFKGIPCPNLGTGGHNFHSVYEYITVEDMEKVSTILIEIVKSYSKEYGLIKRRKSV